jgi:hypothetical protein
VRHVVAELFGVWVQALVPLHVLVMQGVDVQVIAVPWHAPPVQTSLYVHRLPSSQNESMVQPQPSTASSRQKYSSPSQLCVSHSEYVTSSQGYEPPATQVPVALAAPQPVQLWFTSSRFSVQVSPPAPHSPAAVWHPSVALHDAVQHSFPTPTPHAFGTAVQAQLLHVSSVPLQCRAQVGG